MNKADIKLVVTFILIGIGCFLCLQNKSDKLAIVYYENKEILKINLNDNKTEEYTVKGYNGDIVIEKKGNKIRVKEEISPLHLCSKQGFVDNSYTPIICLPNKIIIKIVDQEKIDTVVR